jgi:hypothetical protein
MTTNNTDSITDDKIIDVRWVCGSRLIASSTYVGDAIYHIIHLSQKSLWKFVQNYHLTFSRLCAIINTES